VSDRTDQYALAVCYCVLRGGRLPFPDTPDHFAPNYTRPAPDLSMLSPAERPAVARALAPVPPDRWPSCGELIAELTRQAAPDALPQGGERRRARRYRVGPGVMCAVQAPPTAGTWRAEVCNVSAGGIRLRVRRPGCPLRPGRVLDLALSDTARELLLMVRLRVTHGTERDAGDYEVGGRFDREFLPEELEALAEGGAA
jgi:hypothetical protein